MCGLLGYSGKKINKYKFNILGLFNDSRGGDACGVFMGNGNQIQLEYGTDKESLYSDFVANGRGSQLNFENLHFALGHCRKASVGGVKAELAQPVVLRDDEGNPLFAMIHNGTLLNYIELAKKHNVDYAVGESDSQIFCRIIYKIGYGVLMEYDGAGAFIFWDPRVDRDGILVFKGASQYYSNDDKLYIERPLFFLQGKKELYISSIEDSLRFINDKGGEIVDINSNVLYTIKDGAIVSELSIERTARKQVNVLGWNNKMGKQFPAIASGYGRHGMYDGYDSTWDEYYGDSAFYNSRSGAFTKKDDFKDNGKYVISCGPTDAILPTQTSGIVKDKVYFDVDGLYKLNGELCDGIYDLSYTGYELKYNTENYYFLLGVMMKSYFHYLCAIEYCNKYYSDGENVIDNMDVVQWHLSKFSTTPVPLQILDMESNVSGVFFGTYNEEAGETVEFTGTLTPFFGYTRLDYTVKDGFIEYYNKYSVKHVYEADLESTMLDNKILDERIKGNELLILIESEC